MTDAEKTIMKDLLHTLADKELPALIAAEEAKLPETYKGLVQLVMSAMQPQMMAMIDAKIDAI